MMKIIRWLLCVLLLTAVFSREAKANSHAAASCAGSDVQTAINSAVPGDTVTVPAGTCNWSGGLSISGISLIGAGSSTSGTVITAGGVTMTKHATQVTRLSGFRFTGTDIHGSIGGNASNRAYVIDHNYFYSDGTAIFFTVNANGGLWHHNDFFTPPSTAGGPDALPLHPNEDWSQATTFGTADTQGPNGGERNIYFEDNTFENVLETAPDGDQGVRVVIRHNKYTDSSIVFHGGGPVNDTSSDGTRQFEIYNNTFSRVNCNDNLNKWIWVRGGSGIIANNAMDVVSTSCYGGKVEIELGIGCEGSPAYPIEHQIGQTTAPTTQNPPTQPLLIFGNTGAGASDANFLVTVANDTGGGGHTCSSPGTYIQANRDYYTSNHWGWAPFTYPHPLVGSGSSSAPAPPSGLSATIQ
jgi:hypothetical protein